MLRRFGACFVALAGAAILGMGACNEGGQGDRCNPLRSSNECGGGLVCAGNPIGQSTAYAIPFCPENYCCPLNADGMLDYASASSPYCQPGCNGGAASECAVSTSPADAEACAVAACLADAADPTTCVAESEGGAVEPVADAAPSDATPEAAVSEAGPADAGTSEAAAEAQAPTDGSADSAPND